MRGILIDSCRVDGRMRVGRNVGNERTRDARHEFGLVGESKDLVAGIRQGVYNQFSLVFRIDPGKRLIRLDGREKNGMDEMFVMGYVLKDLFGIE